MEARTPIDSILKRHGLTAEQLCELAGISNSAIRAWRGGQRVAAIRTVLVLEEKTGIPRHECYYEFGQASVLRNALSPTPPGPEGSNGNELLRVQWVAGA